MHKSATATDPEKVETQMPLEQWHWPNSVQQTKWTRKKNETTWVATAQAFSSMEKEKHMFPSSQSLGEVLTCPFMPLSPIAMSPAFSVLHFCTHPSFEKKHAKLESPKCAHLISLHVMPKPRIRFLSSDVRPCVEITLVAIIQNFQCQHIRAMQCFVHAANCPRPERQDRRSAWAIVHTSTLFLLVNNVHSDDGIKAWSV